MRRFTAVLCALLAVIVGASCAFGDATEQLLKAVQSEHVNARTVERLIESGADVNARDEEGNTALISLLSSINYEDSKHNKAYFDAVKVLIKYGADVNAKGEDGRTALMHAYKPEIVKLLIEAGADVNARYNDDWTALMWAAYQGQTETVKFLIKYGANVNAKSNNQGGVTALMLAAESLEWWNTSNEGYAEIVKALMKAGANIHIKDSEGKTALIHAVKSYEIKGPDAKLNPHIVQLLIKSGAKVNVQDKDGMTALMYATRNPWEKEEGSYSPFPPEYMNASLEAVKVLIKAKADINLRDKYGITALMYAAGSFNPEVVKLLVNSGADVNAKDNDGKTALDYVSYDNYEENEEVRKILQDAMKKK